MQEGLDHCIPSTSSAESSTQIHIAYCPPADEAMQVDIKDPSSAGKVILNNSNIVAYFVSRSVYDGLPACDFKGINKSAQYLFRCGHVQIIHKLINSLSSPVTAIIISFFLSIAIIYNFIFLLVN